MGHCFCLTVVRITAFIGDMSVEHASAVSSSLQTVA